MDRSAQSQNSLYPLSPREKGGGEGAADTKADLARLRWRCRRGMRELDVVFQRYLEQRYALAPAAEQRAFESLVELQDPQLLAYLMGRETPSDPEQLDVIAFFTRLPEAGP